MMRMNPGQARKKYSGRLSAKISRNGQLKQSMPERKRKIQISLLFIRPTREPGDREGCSKKTMGKVVGFSR